MSFATIGPSGHRRIVVADEDPKVVDFVMDTLRADGHTVFHAYDVLAAVQLALGLRICDLVISNTKVQGVDGISLIGRLRDYLPTLPILYLANIGRSTPELEQQLPANVPILREPFTAEDLRGAVAKLLGDGKGFSSLPEERLSPSQEASGTDQDWPV
jgi:two-component system OmpR family response regulator